MDPGAVSTLDDPQVHRALGNTTRRRILDRLNGDPGGLRVETLAEAVGLHATTVRQHLQVLMDAGLVSRVVAEREGPGRPSHLYRPGAEPVATPGGYRLLAEMLVSHLATLPDAAGEAERAGEAWGGFLVDEAPPGESTTASGARATLAELFERLGFAPSQPTTEQMHLHRCPFSDLAARHQDVVCSLHKGVVRGALDRLRAPLEPGELEPFVQPSLCVLNLQSRGN